VPSRTLPERLGPLAGREFKLLFSATLITTAGDRLAAIALAFAVLGLAGAGPSDLGIILAVRQAVEIGVLLFGGVLSDRLPRNFVLGGASLVQAGAQAATAALVLGGGAPIAAIVAVQALYGAGAGLVDPAERGLVQQTVSSEHLQQANALLGLSRNVVTVVGYAVGGAIVVAASPGVALAADAATFVICALLLVEIRVGKRPARTEPSSFLRELYEGWQEFTSRTWLWTTVLLFGFGNMLYAGCWVVLGPSIAETHLGGAGAWAIVLAVGGIGALVGGVVALRIRPARPLLVCCLAACPILLELVGLALQVPTAVLAVFAFVASIGLSIHLALWSTVFQQHVPEHAQSRVSSYDSLGSFVLIPLGMAIVGPLAASMGTSATVWLAAGVSAACFTIMLSLPSVRELRRPRPGVTLIAAR
jgi:MFS family permease